MSTTEILEATLLSMVNALPPGKTLSPGDIAQAVAGKSSEQWGPLMQPLRRIAVRLAKEGKISIYRKGSPADPDNFKGVYRLASVKAD